MSHVHPRLLGSFLAGALIASLQASAEGGVLELTKPFGSDSRGATDPALQTPEPLLNWHWRNPRPQGDPLNSVVFVGETFLAVGYGFVLTSPNAVSWELTRNASIPELHDVIYGNRFVGVTALGGTAVSSDGVNWTTHDSGPGPALKRVAFGGGMFVGVEGYTWPPPDRTTILTSPDGVTWTARDAGTSNVLFGISYSQGLFVAVGDQGTVALSSDGVSWKAHQTKTNSTLAAVTFGNNLFVAVGSGSTDGEPSFGRGLIMTSADGVHWDSGPFTSGGLNNIAYGNGVLSPPEGHAAVMAATRWW